jgi:hypothetical protein
MENKLEIKFHYSVSFYAYTNKINEIPENANIVSINNIFVICKCSNCGYPILTTDKKNNNIYYVPDGNGDYNLRHANCNNGEFLKLTNSIE